MTSLLSWRALFAASVVSLLFACGFEDRAELECEEAVSHLEECCPAFPSSLLTCVREQGCGSRTEPALDFGEATCLKSKSCDDLRVRGYCQRARMARGATFSTEDQYSARQRASLEGQASVCP